MANTKKTTKNQKSQPAKLTYNDIIDIVEYLVKTKCRNYTFDCFEPDDIAQEIRLICLKSLNHFDSEKVEEEKRVNFFGRCVDNALKNLKRDKYIRYSSPCPGDCELLHGDDEELSKICKKWFRHQQNLQRKINIKHPVSLELFGELTDSKFEEQIEINDLKKYLIERIDKSLRSALVAIMSGNKKSVSIRDRKKVQACVERILQK